MKITTKTTKEEMTKFLGANAEAVKNTNKELFDRLAYAGKMYKKDPEKVTRKDLVDLVKDVVACLTPAPAPVVAEASLKKPLKKGQKKSESKSEEVSEPVAEEVAPVEEKTEKVDKKSANKTKAEKPAKKSGVAVLNDKASEKSIQLADTFTDTLEVDGAKYEIAHDIKSMDDLYKALEAEEVVVFAMYWTKRHLKQFNYFGGLLSTPKEFPMDLDLCTCVYASDEGKVAYAVSTYTEAFYTLLPDHLTEDEDGIRYSGGIEYQIYRQVE